MSLLQRQLAFGKPGFRWLTYEHCDSGDRRLLHADPGQPNPEMSKGWVLVHTTLHDPSWSATQVYLNTKLLH